MKRNLAFIGFFVSALSWGATNVGPAPVKHLYIPDGFDNNDSVEVVVTGYFPNPCYSRNTVEVLVKDDVVEVLVTALQTENKLLCPDMAVPFKEVVALGNLQGGHYKIHVNSTLSGQLKIGEADSNSVDDHLYAAIDQIESKGAGKYVLKGWRYSPCIELDHIEVISNKNDTLSVLPIMKQVSDFCPMKLTPVSYPVNLDLSSLKENESLIHVRTMDGKSFNTLIKLNEQR